MGRTAAMVTYCVKNNNRVLPVIEMIASSIDIMNYQVLGSDGNCFKPP